MKLPGETLASIKVFTANFKMEALNLSLEHLSIKISPGDDNIHVEFLKHIDKAGNKTILHVFNIS